MTRRVSYGVDAPGVLIGLAAGGTALLAVAAVSAVLGLGGWAVAGPLVGGVFTVASTALFLHTTLRGKHAVWAELLDRLQLVGDERVLDVGCGRGAALLAAAPRLTDGRAVGVDLWRSVDQSSNSPDQVVRSARASALADRVEVRTGDMTARPFGDASFDVVVSSVAIYNIATGAGGMRAVDEAVRVLRPDGRLVLVDILYTSSYVRRLIAVGLRPERHGLGWRFWYGGPWMAARVVTADPGVTRAAHQPSACTGGAHPGRRIRQKGWPAGSA